MHSYLFSRPLSQNFVLTKKDLPMDEVDKEADIMLKLPKHDNVLKGLDYVKSPLLVNIFTSGWSLSSAA